VLVEDGLRVFRALQPDDGTWVCRQGRYDIDQHAERRQAVEHLRQLARSDPRRVVWVHPLQKTTAADDIKAYRRFLEQTGDCRRSLR